jgi:hypothetical protein
MSKITDDENVATINMTISPFMEKEFSGFPFFLEIEMLQGNRKQLKDGRVKYKIQITDPEKILMVKEFCLKTISLSHKVNLS